MRTICTLAGTKGRFTEVVAFIVEGIHFSARVDPASYNNNLCTLIQVFLATYCKSVSASLSSSCEDFVMNAKQYMPSLLQKSKVHLLLHLSTNVEDFGHAASFNSER